MRRYLPETETAPEFQSTESIVAWAQDTARQVLTGVVDPRAAGEARQLAALTISARAADAQERLAEALLRIEHGGQATAMLFRLTEGLQSGKRRPLPGRSLAAVRPPDGDGAA